MQEPLPEWNGLFNKEVPRGPWGTHVQLGGPRKAVWNHRDVLTPGWGQRRSVVSLDAWKPESGCAFQHVWETGRREEKVALHCVQGQKQWTRITCEPIGKAGHPAGSSAFASNGRETEGRLRATTAPESARTLGPRTEKRRQKDFRQRQRDTQKPQMRLWSHGQTNYCQNGSRTPNVAVTSLFSDAGQFSTSARAALGHFW